MEELSPEALAGEFLMRYDAVEGAAEALRRAVDVAAGNTDAQVHARLAQALCALDDLQGAVEQYEHVKRLGPDDALVESNLGLVLTLQGRLEEGMAAHRRALLSIPDVGVTPLRVLLIWNAAHTLLASGDLINGWDAYEARIPLGLGAVVNHGLADWGAARPDQRDVLVLGEQGIGDEVLYASCLPDLLIEAAHVHVECEARLAPLMGRSFPAAEVGVRGTWSEASSVAPQEAPRRCIALGSLPRRYRRSLSDFPADGAYLRPEPGRVDTWRLRLDALAPGARVGISWRSVRTDGARRREYAPLVEWAPILEQPGVQFIDLQYGDCEDELLDVEGRLGITIHRWSDTDLLNDLDRVAALIAALDLVIAPRNSVAHLAGAVGTPTLMLANPHVWSDLGTDSLPWFPAVTSLYRSPGGAWSEPIARAAAAVGQLAASRSRKAL